jgi:hypothetical protein
MLLKRTAALLLLCLLLAPAAQGKGMPQKESFGQTRDGQAVDIYTLKNARGAEARITTYGGAVVSLKVPDRRASTKSSGRPGPWPRAAARRSNLPI